MIPRIVIFFFVLFTTFNTAIATEHPYILKDLSTNQILEKKFESESVSMGPVVRLLILYALLDELEKRDIAWQENVPFFNTQQKYQIHSLKITKNDHVSYENLLKAYLITGFDDIGDVLLRALWEDGALQAVREKIQNLNLSSVYLYEL